MELVVSMFLGLVRFCPIMQFLCVLYSSVEENGASPFPAFLAQQGESQTVT